MVMQTPVNTEREDTIIEEKPPITQEKLISRVKNAIWTNIGVYEIRMNLFLWDLFRTAKQKEISPH